MKQNYCFLTIKMVFLIISVFILLGCMTSQEYLIKGDNVITWKRNGWEKREQNYNKALEQALKNEPDNIELKNEVVNRFIKMGEDINNISEAERLFNKAIELDPDRTQEINEKLVKRYINTMRNGYDVEKYFEKAISISPENMDIYFAKGKGSRNTINAINTFNEILENDSLYKCLPVSYYLGSLDTYGFKNTNQFRCWNNNNGIDLENCSLYALIGSLYYGLALRTNPTPSPTEKTAYLDNALQNLKKGYDLDIIEKQNDTREAKTIYLMQIANAFFLKEDYSTALEYYSTFLNDETITFDKDGIRERRQQIQEKNYEQAAINNPNDAKAQYEWAYFLNYTKKNNAQAAQFYEKALTIDPDYRINNSFHWTPQAASNNGVLITEDLNFQNFSIYFLLGQVLSDYEKKLSAYCKAYEIDIIGGRSSNANVKIIYLGQIAHVLGNLNRQPEANAIYKELAKIATLTNTISARIRNIPAENIPAYVTAFVQGASSYYVSANGNNNNNGLSEAAPLRSLSLAYQKASAGSIKRITVIGTLNQRSEGSTQSGSGTGVFNISSSNNAINTGEILISGKFGEPRAVLSGTGSGKNVVSVVSPVRFENIEISGGELDAEKNGGYGIHIEVTTVIGSGTVVRSNKGRGVSIMGVPSVPSLYVNCTLAGGEIRNNAGEGVSILFGNFSMTSGTITSNSDSGVDVLLGTFTMSGGTISNNTATSGGGISVFLNSTFVMSGGTISNNTATAGGGGVYISANGTFTMSGGTISNNKADYGGGVCLLLNSTFADSPTFRQSGGSITSNSARAAGGVLVGDKTTYNRTAGTVSNNTATHFFNDQLQGSNANVTRRQGSSGSGF